MISAQLYLLFHLPSWPALQSCHPPSSSLFPTERKGLLYRNSELFAGIQPAGQVESPVGKKELLQGSGNTIGARISLKSEEYLVPSFLP